MCGQTPVPKLYKFTYNSLAQHFLVSGNNALSFAVLRVIGLWNSTPQDVGLTVNLEGECNGRYLRRVSLSREPVWCSGQGDRLGLSVGLGSNPHSAVETYCWGGKTLLNISLRKPYQGQYKSEQFDGYQIGYKEKSVCYDSLLMKSVLKILLLK